MRKYDFYSDSMHGWLKVERRELVELGIENQISGYSYQKGDCVYLEEDGDASKFMDAWEAKHQVKLMNSQITYHIADRASKIRRYQPFNPKILCELCGCFTSLPIRHKGKQLCEQCYLGETNH